MGSPPLRVQSLDRRALLLGTALATTLVLGTVLAPRDAAAVTDCTAGTGPEPIEVLSGAAIVCNNNEERNGEYAGNSYDAINLGGGADITLNNGANGELYSRYNGISVATYNGTSNATLTINNAGKITALDRGIHLFIVGDYNNLKILNSGDIDATNFAIRVDVPETSGYHDNTLYVNNTGVLVSDYQGITVTAGSNRSDYTKIEIVNENAITAGDTGIFALTVAQGSPIEIVNSGDLKTGRHGIEASTDASGGDISIANYADVTATESGIVATAHGRGSQVFISNIATLKVGDSGIVTDTRGGEGAYTKIHNEGNIISTNESGIVANSAGSDDAYVYIYNNGTLEVAKDGIAVNHGSFDSDSNSITVINKGPINAGYHGINVRGYNDGGYGDVFVYNAVGITSGTRATNSNGDAIYAYSRAGNVTVENSGVLDAQGHGIYASAKYGDLTVENSAAINATRDGIRAVVTCHPREDGSNCEPFGNSVYPAGSITIHNQKSIHAGGAGVFATTPYGDVGIVNTGAVEAAGHGIAAYVFGDSNAIEITNSNAIDAGGIGIKAAANGAQSTNLIVNTGSVFGAEAGIVAFSNAGTHIVNTGDLTAQSLLAIEVTGPGDALIENAGTITGYVLLDADDVFHNQAGGTFEARLTSDFGPGSDLFLNEGTVHTAANPNAAETTRFVNLERFDNKGTISLQDGKEGDRFEITNGGTGDGTGLSFSGSGKSTLAVDTFLGPPGSKSDVLTIDGDASGKTGITVHNTNPGAGAYNPTGIPVVYVNGKTKGNEFYLPDGPIDAGFFDYDLFFKPTGSGVFYLRNFIGGGAYVLPQLVTAAQDLFAATSETWLDRTADLRVLLNGGAPLAVSNLKGSGVTYTRSYEFTPAVWARGTGAWLNRDGSANTTVQGRSYRFDLDREFEAGDFQSGVDFGKRDLLAQGDILVFGFLGGGVFGSLDYDKLARHFTFSGAEAGGYFTYLNRGLFVDTLVKADFLELEQSIVGFPDTIDATNFGIRTDSGYRFGGFRGGFFIEPQATIEVIWSDIDSFAVGGNSVSFDDDPNVRGRLGLRVGTSYEAWTGTTMEPFLIGSVWGNLSGDNHATLVSGGTTFNLADDPGDAWGVVSGGVNFFNPGANTSVFAKLDVSFGDDIDGLTGRLGMRTTW